MQRAKQDQALGRAGDSGPGVFLACFQGVVLRKEECPPIVSRGSRKDMRRPLLRLQSTLPSLAPSAARITTEQLAALTDHVLASRRLLVITGAGFSTHSGIPDYRSPNGSYSRGHTPIQHNAFMRDPAARRRYWTRSFVGWQYFSRAQPNAAHRALAELEAHGLVQETVTQNVDGLHSAAGMVNVLDLHGRIDAVECTECGVTSPRARLQERLREANAEWAASLPQLKPTELRADGDSEIRETDAFVVPSCELCDGILKPAVTFFGGNVPANKVQAAAQAVANADSLLVAGSSLQVFSAFRLVRAAAAAALPIAIINNGPTRADDLATQLLPCDVCDVLPALANAVGDDARGG